MMVPKPNFKKRKPTRGKRGKFSKKVIEKIIERDDGLCVLCFKKADDIHHCKLKSRGGRGVFENGVCLCRYHHDKAHNNAGVMELLQNRMINKYGENYYKDDFDE